MKLIRGVKLSVSYAYLMFFKAIPVIFEHGKVWGHESISTDELYHILRTRDINLYKKLRGINLMLVMLSKKGNK